jgi:hypothetical protein
MAMATVAVVFFLLELHSEGEVRIIVVLRVSGNAVCGWRRGGIVEEAPHLLSGRWRWCLCAADWAEVSAEEFIATALHIDHPLKDDLLVAGKAHICHKPDKPPAIARPEDSHEMVVSE